MLDYFTQRFLKDPIVKTRMASCDFCRSEVMTARTLPYGGIACRLRLIDPASRSRAQKCRGCAALSKYFD